MLRSSCLARMSLPKHTLFTFRTKLSFLATRYNFQASSWLSKKPSCMKILLNVHMRPATIALNYSVENIRNNIRQKIIIIIYEKSQFDSLVWGSLRLAPITLCKSYSLFSGILIPDRNTVSTQGVGSPMTIATNILE